MAVPVRAVLLIGFEMARPFGRFCMERRLVGCFLDGLVFLIELLLKHLVLSIAIVATVAAAI
uniref:Uncharacterized protein MANES_13G019200 n=1 Tax=Rhizophora mucronata TaxID=61149 RepID=A0A2P2J6W8_RHIMU